MSINSEVDAVEEMKSHENEEDAEDDIGDFIVHGEAAEEIRPKINVDDVLRELVERKSKMQSYSQFNLDAAVADLNDEYTRAVTSNSRNRTCRRELRNMDANADMDRSASRISSQMKNLVVHSSEDGYKAVTKFDEMMKRLKSTVAAHKLSIPNGEAIFEASLLSEPSDAKQV